GIPGVTRDGQVIHRRGVTEIPGLYFLGLSWQHTRGSALLGFVHDDAAYLASRINTTASAAQAAAQPAPQPAAWCNALGAIGPGVALVRRIRPRARSPRCHGVQPRRPAARQARPEERWYGGRCRRAPSPRHSLQARPLLAGTSARTSLTAI